MNLTDEEIRIKVAEAMWWTNITAFHFEDVVTGKPKILHKGDCPTLEIEDQWLPNYPESLDACAKFEATLTDEEKASYVMRLNASHPTSDIFYPDQSERGFNNKLAREVFGLVSATARQRCLAFVQTKGLIP